MDNKQSVIKRFLADNAVMVLFIPVCILCMAASGQSLHFVAGSLIERLGRNLFMVLALIIPIVAGMGINFAITIGAMAAQIALLWVVEWQVPGISGLALAALMTIPIAGFFGYLVGKLLNRMKGQEMIGSMILGYFANGLFQLLFLFIFGNLLPLRTPGLVIKGSVGVANTMDLGPNGIRKVLTKLWNPTFFPALYLLAGLLAVCVVWMWLRKSRHAKKSSVALGAVLLCGALAHMPTISGMLQDIAVPMGTYMAVALLCLFNLFIMRTRMGQQFRAVGQNGAVANAAGIHVDRVRVRAIIFSTILAGWGQLIFLQDMGAYQTYSAHEQVGLYAGAAILVGGASVARATSAQALIGCILLHALFIVAPPAAKNLFGDAAIGEHFRVFISYAVIAVSLVLHGLRGYNAHKNPAAGLRTAGEKA